MEPLTLIAQARAAGLELWTEGDRLKVRGPREAEPIVAQLRDQKPAVMALLAAGDMEVQWRLAAFRERIPAHGPIWPPRLRDTPLCDTPGHCSLCGDPLPTDQDALPRFPRCRPCVRALWLALNAEREGAPA